MSLNLIKNAILFPGGDRIPGPDFIFNCEALCIVGYGLSLSLSLSSLVNKHRIIRFRFEFSTLLAVCY